MKLRLLVALPIAILLGCSQADDQAVYDTAGNPQDFPPAAVALLVSLENGQLIGSEPITEAFGELYTEHSELLDHDEWKTVIGRLGGTFGRMADSLADREPGSYGLAAEYYQLASFARPEDPTLRQRALLFNCWLAASGSPLVDLSVLTGSTAPELDAILDVSRHFLLADSLCQEFYRAYLFSVLKGKVDRLDLMNQEAFAGLAPPDRALAVFAGLVSGSEIGKLTTFSPPRIDLAAGQISRTDSAGYRVELYFIPREPIEHRLRIVLLLESETPEATPVEITPRAPATGWLPGQIATVSRAIHHPGLLTSVSIGLVERTGGSQRHLKLIDSDSDFFTLGPAQLKID